MTLLFLISLLAPQALPELIQVIGVERPVDLKGRTVQTPRQVYLSAPHLKDKDLVGRRLKVIRRVPVPGATPLAREVGRVEVVEVLDRVLLAKVLRDALVGGGGALAVRVGDAAELLPSGAGEESVEPPPLSAAEQKMLEAEQKKLEARGRKPAPKGLRRKVMRWTL